MSAPDAAFLAGPAVADGSWSTELQRRGVPPNIPAELANLTQPQIVAALAREYLLAGATILTTNTFGAQRFNFGRRNLKEDPAEVARAGATIAHNVAAGKAHVGGSIGPSGKIMIVREVPESDLRASFASHAAALAEGGVDFILLETFSEMAEIMLAIEAVRSACSLPIVASLSFDSGPQRTHTMMGVSAEEAARSLESAGVAAVGCNCGAGVNTILPAVVALRAGTILPVWVKPNAGLPDLVDGRPVYAVSIDDFAEHAPALFEAGANVVGGCCGVGPEHIKRIAALVASRGRKPRGAQKI